MEIELIETLTIELNEEGKFATIRVDDLLNLVRKLLTTLSDSVTPGSLDVDPGDLLGVGYGIAVEQTSWRSV